ncbi:ROK family protein [Pseudoalteromonas fenneropenaei]|uniref:N-acetylglucosamine kinase n=1 Tax=Pseudoalteromonas fenneropenaei TaxID=1737459 RepID=A0ABV7CPI7_9GAMM
MIYGVDIGGTKIEIAVFDSDLNLLESWRQATPQHSYTDFLQALSGLIANADEKYHCSGKVGIGMPGIVNADGEVLSANLPYANGKRVADDLELLLGRNIAIENDCRCFALSEGSGGAGEGYSRVYGAIIGTGAAGGMCIDGQLYKSAQGIAGEYGHHPLPAHLFQKYQLPIESCGCGLTGCLERYIAGPGLARIYQHHGGECLSSVEIVAQLRQDLPIAINSFSCYMDLLGSAFANIVMAYDPEVIVLGGGMSLVDEVVETLPAAISQHVFNNISVPKIIRARFGDASGARGAAILGSQL